MKLPRVKFLPFTLLPLYLTAGPCRPALASTETESFPGPRPAVVESSPGPRPRDAEPVTLIRCARLLDGRGASPLADVAVLVRGSKIAEVGPASSVKAPAGARVLDLGTATVLPGLVDAHLHLNDRPDLYGDIQMRSSSAELALYASMHARITLESGITTVRDLGSWGFHTVPLRNLVNRGLLPGPRMLLATRGLSATGGHLDMNGYPYELAVPGLAEIVDGAEAVRRAVREQIKYGADLIKIFATGGIDSAGTEPGAQEYTYEEIRVAVEEAGRRGRKVAAHAHGSEGIKDAVRAGVVSIEHGSFLDAEAAQMMKERGVFLVPTLHVIEAIAEGEPGMPSFAAEKARKVIDRQRESYRLALKLGVPIAFGSDAGGIPHGTNARELASLVSQGMSPAEAILAATSGAARLLGLAEELGTVEAGKAADLIAVAGNPLSDISLLQKIGFVMKGGEVIKNSLK